MLAKIKRRLNFCCFIYLIYNLIAASQYSLANDLSKNTPEFTSTLRPTQTGHSKPVCVAPSGQCPPEELRLFVGESRLLSVPRIQRIAVGSGRLLSANVINENEILIFANQAGITTLSLWAGSPIENTPPQQIRIYILPSETAKTQYEVADFVAGINGAQARIVGDKVIIEGENLSDFDQEKISEITKRYPQVINFTNRIGWEKMILIDVQVVEFPTATLRQLGVQWQGSTPGISAGINWHSHRDRQSVAGPFAFLGIDTLLQAQIHLLAQNGDAAILAQPRLSTRNGSTAVFFAGGEIPYQVSEERDRRSVVFKPYGVKLEIQPRIDRQGIIRATIETEVSSIDTALETQSGPALRTRKTKAEFNLREGQTMILSGFINREQIRHQQKLPGLGDLPILGALFRSEKFQQRETELVVFVTPHINDPSLQPIAQQLEATHAKLQHVLGPHSSQLLLQAPPSSPPLPPLPSSLMTPSLLPPRPPTLSPTMTTPILPTTTLPQTDIPLPLPLIEVDKQ